ncbi:MAG: hypothetical protein RQ715_06230 [Methylococcales bacterium]|nr:hypothetical protein [Methylococcales bacterium]
MRSLLIRQRGVGLLEVLIATGVIAFGLLAVSSLQVGLLGESGDNKIRAEAIVLANQKKAEFRDRVDAGIWPTNSADSADPRNIASGKDQIDGTNAVFQRFWQVTPVTNPDQRLEVAVYVTWGATGDLVKAAGDSAAALTAMNSSASVQDERVSVQTELTLQDPIASLNAAAGSLGLTKSPSPVAGSSDEIFDERNIPLFDDNNQLLEGIDAHDASQGLYTREVEGETQYLKDLGDGFGEVVFLCPDASANITEFENGLFARRVDDDELDGKESIELFVPTGDGLSCRREIRFNGGIIIPISGIVYSRATQKNNDPLLDVSLFTFNASESGAFCVFKPEPDSTSAPYVCYVGGNCADGPDGIHNLDGDIATAGQDTWFTECPKPAIAKQSVGPGGWRGNVGLLGVASNGDNTCFAEELAGAPATLNTARNYFTRRQNGSIIRNEGVNKPYDCHNFLIINGKNTKTQVANECQKQAQSISNLKLASKFIQRSLSGTTLNAVDTSVDNSLCPGVSAPTFILSGNFDPEAGSTPTVTITDGNTSNTCTATTTTYSCTITTDQPKVTISASQGGKDDSCIVAPSSTGCTLTLATATNHTWTINGQITGGKRDEVTVAINGSDCNMTHPTDGSPSTYQCTLETTARTATLNATGGGVTPSDVTMELNPLTDDNGNLSYAIEGPNFSAIIPRTLEGTISIARQVTVTETSIAVLEGSCNSFTSTTGNQTYTCTVPDGVANTLTLTISPRCSVARQSKAFEITQGSDSATGTGTLAIDLGTVTSNISKDFDIGVSNEKCQ